DDTSSSAAGSPAVCARGAATTSARRPAAVQSAGRPSWPARDLIVWIIATEFVRDDLPRQSCKARYCVPPVLSSAISYNLHLQPRHMTRRLLNLLTALSLLLFVAVAALWVRSHWVRDTVEWVIEGHFRSSGVPYLYYEKRAATSARGGLRVDRERFQTAYVMSRSCVWTPPGLAHVASDFSRQLPDPQTARVAAVDAIQHVMGRVSGVGCGRPARQRRTVSRVRSSHVATLRNARCVSGGKPTDGSATAGATRFGRPPWSSCWSASCGVGTPTG